MLVGWGTGAKVPAGNCRRWALFRRSLKLYYYPPLEGGSKNSSVSEEFFGEGACRTLPRTPPRNCLRAARKSNFDPPSRGGWSTATSRLAPDAAVPDRPERRLSSLRPPARRGCRRMDRGGP